VIEEIRSIVGSDVAAQTIPKADNFIEIPDQFLDSTKLFDLGYRPKVEFAEGVRRTVDWYQSHQDLLTRMGANHILLR
jgi:CDP-glucose 4,6-dehydratase